MYLFREKRGEISVNIMAFALGGENKTENGIKWNEYTLTGSLYRGYTGISSLFTNMASATTGPVIASIAATTTAQIIHKSHT